MMLSGHTSGRGSHDPVPPQSPRGFEQYLAGPQSSFRSHGRHGTPGRQNAWRATNRRALRGRRVTKRPRIAVHGLFTTARRRTPLVDPHASQDARTTVPRDVVRNDAGTVGQPLAIVTVPFAIVTTSFVNAPAGLDKSGSPTTTYSPSGQTAAALPMNTNPTSTTTAKRIMLRSPSSGAIVATERAGCQRPNVVWSLRG
jgi:hypothetical protein